MEPLQIIDEFEGESTFQLASIGARFGAYILDVIIIVVIQLLLFGAIYGFEGMENMSTAEELISDLFSFALVILYFGIQEGSVGATIGKRAVGIKVVQENGDSLGLGKGFLRAFGRILSGLILLIGYIMAFFNKRNKTLHDEMASTLVVKG